MSSYFNSEGEPLMTAAEARFEAYLEGEYAASRSGCGTIGCEAHDGECMNDWGHGDDDHLTDVEADAMTFVSVGWGTDEDYGYYGQEDAWLDGSYEE